jgi:hypothetical protein
MPQLMVRSANITADFMELALRSTVGSVEAVVQARFPP